IDDESERVIFETDRVVDGFMSALARTYGTEAVAVRVDPRSGPFSGGGATLVPVANAAPFEDAPRELGLVGLIAVAAVMPLAGVRAAAKAPAGAGNAIRAGTGRPHRDSRSPRERTPRPSREADRSRSPRATQWR